MIVYSFGFLFCLGLLFYFIAKYKEGDLQEEKFSLEVDEHQVSNKSSENKNSEKDKSESTPMQDFFEDVKEETTAVQQVQKLFTKTESLPAREIFDLKDKVKDFSYVLEENRLLETKHYNELKTLAENLEKRLSSFENEYINKMYPMLTNLIKELEALQNKNINK